MEMEMEAWETDEKMQRVLVAVIRIVGKKRTVLTTYREISRNAGWLRIDILAATLKRLRHEGVIALRTAAGRGMQVTLLRKLHIEREPATAHRR